jgi:hypothetical protein
MRPNRSSSRVIFISLVIPLLICACPKNQNTVDIQDNLKHILSEDMGKKPNISAHLDTSVGGTETLPHKFERLLELPLFPKSEIVESLSQISEKSINVVLSSDQPIDDIVKFYEHSTQKVAQVVELPDRIMYTFVLDEREGKIIKAIQISQIPENLSSPELKGKFSITIFKKL